VKQFSSRCRGVKGIEQKYAMRFDITAAKHGVISDPRGIVVYLGIQERPGISRGKSVRVQTMWRKLMGTSG
jgi:hypothetical protein